MKYFLLTFILFFSSCFLFEDDNDEQNTNLTLSLHSAGVTTVNLNISPEDSLAEFTFELTRDDSTVQTLSLQSDTLIKDTGLNPNTSYTYKGYWKNGTERIGESDSLTVSTMDTTSHNFTWEIDTIGIYGSYLNDVAIIDENNIWVVGMIKMPDPDSSFNGTGREIFNAAHWDGNEWELILINDHRADFDAVFVFNENEIWFSSGCFIYFYDGETFDKKWECDYETYGAGQVNEIWGNSSANLYFCGKRGKIVHYDGSEFQYMESGTDVDLLDIDGTLNGEHIFVVGWDDNFPAPCVVLEYTNETWNTIYYTEGSLSHNGNVGWAWGVGVMQDTVYITTSEGVWKYNFTIQDSVLIPNSISHMNLSAFKSVNIKSINDIFFAGSGFHYIHFNGITFKHSQEITNMFVQRAMWGADYNGGLAVMVGMFDSFSHAMVAKGFQE